MPYLRDTAIVLKKEPFREQDRRYTLYGREHGLLIGVARGSSHIRSKQAGHLEPFMETQVMIAKGSAFDKLAVASRSRPPSVETSAMRLSFYAICGSVADLLVRLMRPGIADERIFELLRELIDCLSCLPHELSTDRARLILSASTLRLLDLLGFAPPIERNPLLSFMRRSSFVDVLRVTAPVDALRAASSFVEEALTHTHLDREPHGPATIRALLGSQG